VVLSVIGTLPVFLEPATFHFSLYRPSTSVLCAQNCEMYSDPVDQKICFPTAGTFCQHCAQSLMCAEPVFQGVGRGQSSLSLHFVNPVMVAPSGAVPFCGLKPQSSYASVSVTM
jgi:hypothetical protein